MNSRRKFLQHMAALAALSSLSKMSSAASDSFVMTVSGKVDTSALKFTLTHEHVLVDFIGADKIVPGRYKVQEVIDIALPHLMAVKKNGCNTFIDCTPAFIGRDVNLLKTLAEKTGLNIITTTGYYGAAKEKYVPAFAYRETAEQLAKRWINEWKNGIDGTDIRPGLIKTGVDNAPLTEVQRKLIKAAAITHLATGLTIGIHTGNGAAADEQLAILQENGVHPSARIWIHAQSEPEKTFHIRSAQRDSWISFDGVNAQSLDMHIDFILSMKQEGLLKNVLVSHDSGWYHVGEPNGGTFNHYNTIFTSLIPALKAKGFSDNEIKLIFEINPAKAFAVKVRAI